MSDSERVDKYFTLLDRSLQHRKAREITKSIEVLAELNDLWYTLTLAEKEVVLQRMPDL